MSFNLMGKDFNIKDFIPVLAGGMSPMLGFLAMALLKDNKKAPETTVAANHSAAATDGMPV